MLASDPTLIRRAVNVLCIGVLLAASSAYVFRAEITDAVTEGVSKKDSTEMRVWHGRAPGKLSLRPERDDVAFLRVSELRSGVATPAGVPISFTLVNLGEANNFPNIAVLTTDAKGRPLRQILFSPADYNHGKRFEQEHIELLVRPRLDERRFTVQAFYGDRP